MSVSFEVLSVYNELYLEGFYSTILNPLVLTNFQILATAMYTHTHTHTHTGFNVLWGEILQQDGICL